MTRLTHERVTIKKGSPVFGTVLLDCDLVVCLDISDDLLKDRTRKRTVRSENAINMRRQIQQEICDSGVPMIEFFVG